MQRETGRWGREAEGETKGRDRVKRGKEGMLGGDMWEVRGREERGELKRARREE